MREPSPAEEREPPLDEEERLFRASFAQLVDFYRLEQRGRLVRAFLPAALVFVPLGGVLVASSASARNMPVHVGLTIMLLGITLVACGPISAIFLLLRSIREDAYVGIRVDGLLLKLDPKRPQEVVPWDDVLDVRFEPLSRELLVSLKADGQRVINANFKDITLEQLATRIRDARRLGVWNRLRPRGAG